MDKLLKFFIVEYPVGHALRYGICVAVGYDIRISCFLRGVINGILAFGLSNLTAFLALARSLSLRSFSILQMKLHTLCPG